MGGKLGGMIEPSQTTGKVNRTSGIECRRINRHGGRRGERVQSALDLSVDGREFSLAMEDINAMRSKDQKERIVDGIRKRTNNTGKTEE